MKIQKKDGTTLHKNDACDNWEDILCDKCGKSTRDSESMNFEYAAISSHWGFGSNKDGEHHEAQLCEACYDAIGLRPFIKDYDYDGATCSCDKSNNPVKVFPCRVHYDSIKDPA